MTKPVRSCRTCIYWEKPASIPATSGRMFACSAPLPVLAFPDCITKHYSFRDLLPRSYMERDDGKRCAAWSDTIPRPPA